MCGIFGIANHSDASQMTYLGLYALQHRGQESTGISSSDGGQVYTHKSMGYVADVFSEDVITKLKGLNAIGHTRYSTAGDSKSSFAEIVSGFDQTVPNGGRDEVLNGAFVFQV